MGCTAGQTFTRILSFYQNYCIPSPKTENAKPIKIVINYFSISSGVATSAPIISIQKDFFRASLSALICAGPMPLVN
jgi:hypothetical protein